MIIKVCGMCDADNIVDVARLEPDMMGFIFYARSPRTAFELDPQVVRSLPSSISRVGVFVNHDVASIESIASRYGLTYLQLHGDESVDYCRLVKQKTGCKVIKATTPELAAMYDRAVDWLLFDTPSPLRGGTGERFDWMQTDLYYGCTPWLLSGGLDPNHADELIVKNPTGVDLNSCFEISPGLKNIELLEKFINKIRHNEQNQ